MVVLNIEGEGWEGDGDGDCGDGVEEVKFTLFFNYFYFANKNKYTCSLSSNSLPIIITYSLVYAFLPPRWYIFAIRTRSAIYSNPILT